MNRVRGMWKAACIEYHWWHIMRHRRKGNKLLEAGEPLTSKRLIALSGKINRHGARAFQLEDAYIELMELS